MTVTPTSTKEKSGAQWVSRYPDLKALTDLEDTFEGKVKNFIAALVAAGASHSIGSIKRPEERQYLMYWSYQIARNAADPETVESHPSVAIDWVHRKADGSVDMEKSKQAAEEMVTAYKIKYEPGKTSRHVQCLAVDMNITWTGDLTIKNADGTIVTITSTPKTADNTELHAVGKTYGVIKLVKDPPHWSSDGH